MRLRRETGDFQIVVKPGEQEGEFTANSIRPGLSAEDLIGEVIDMSALGSDYILVIKTATVGNVLQLITVEGVFTYDPATGAISVTEGDPDETNNEDDN